MNKEEAKLYGQPQSEKRTEERTETHACDCISRQAVLEITAETGALETQTRVKALPPANPQQKTGHWIEHKHGGIEHIECSECGIWFLKADLPRKSYCPNCGSYNGGDTNPQPKTGHWEWVQYDGNPNIGNWHCSECNRVVYSPVKAANPIHVYSYCPGCGLKMQEVQLD